MGDFRNMEATARECIVDMNLAAAEEVPPDFPLVESTFGMPDIITPVSGYFPPPETLQMPDSVIPSTECLQGDRAFDSQMPLLYVKDDPGPRLGHWQGLLPFSQLAPELLHQRRPSSYMSNIHETTTNVCQIHEVTPVDAFGDSMHQTKMAAKSEFPVMVSSPPPYVSASQSPPAGFFVPKALLPQAPELLAVVDPNAEVTFFQQTYNVNISYGQAATTSIFNLKQCPSQLVTAGSVDSNVMANSSQQNRQKYASRVAVDENQIREKHISDKYTSWNPSLTRNRSTTLDLKMTGESSGTALRHGNGSDCGISQVAAVQSPEDPDKYLNLNATWESLRMALGSNSSVQGPTVQTAKAAEVAKLTGKESNKALVAQSSADSNKEVAKLTGKESNKALVAQSSADSNKEVAKLTGKESNKALVAQSSADSNKEVAKLTGKESNKALVAQSSADSNKEVAKLTGKESNKALVAQSSADSNKEVAKLTGKESSKALVAQSSADSNKTRKQNPTRKCSADRNKTREQKPRRESSRKAHDSNCSSQGPAPKRVKTVKSKGRQSSRAAVVQSLQDQINNPTWGPCEAGQAAGNSLWALESSSLVHDQRNVLPLQKGVGTSEHQGASSSNQGTLSPITRIREFHNCDRVPGDPLPQLQANVNLFCPNPTFVVNASNSTTIIEWKDWMYHIHQYIKAQFRLVTEILQVEKIKHSYDGLNTSLSTISQLEQNKTQLGCVDRQTHLVNMPQLFNNFAKQQLRRLTQLIESMKLAIQRTFEWHFYYVALLHGDYRVLSLKILAMEMINRDARELLGKESRKFMRFIHALVPGDVQKSPLDVRRMNLERSSQQPEWEGQSRQSTVPENASVEEKRKAIGSDLLARNRSRAIHCEVMRRTLSEELVTGLRFAVELPPCVLNGSAMMDYLRSYFVLMENSIFTMATYFMGCSFSRKDAPIRKIVHKNFHRVQFAKPVHVGLALMAYMCQHMLTNFDSVNMSVKESNVPTEPVKLASHSYLMFRMACVLNPLELRMVDPYFNEYCTRVLNSITNENAAITARVLNFITPENWPHVPSTEENAQISQCHHQQDVDFISSFMVAAQQVWVFHKLCFSMLLRPTVSRVERGAPVDWACMANMDVHSNAAASTVAFMIFPGVFRNGTLIKSRIYLKGDFSYRFA